MIYRPVVDQFVTHIPLDPATATVFAAVFVASALLTARRTTFGLAALVVVQPFALYRDVLWTSITLPKVVLLGVIVGLTVYAGQMRRLRDVPFTAILVALSVYLAAMIVSFAGAAHPGATLREVLKVVQYAASFGAAYLCYRLERDDRAVVAAVAVATIAVTLSALVQELIGAPSGLCIGTAIIPRIAGVIEGPNQLGAYLEVAIATLGAWAIARRSLLVVIALVLAACTDVLTFSRAGIAAVAIIALAWIIYDRRAAWQALTPLLAGAFAGLGIGGLLAAYMHAAGVLRLSLAESQCAGGVGNRTELYGAAIAMWLRHPIVGVGAGNFELELYEVGVYGVRTHANSWYLQSLAEGGIVLFTATVALVITVLVNFGRRLRTQSPWISAAFTATLALALHQIVDYVVFYPKVGGPWWVLLGIAAAAAATHNESA